MCALHLYIWKSTKRSRKTENECTNEQRKYKKKKIERK